MQKDKVLCMCQVVNLNSSFFVAYGDTVRSATVAQFLRNFLITFSNIHLYITGKRPPLCVTPVLILNGAGSSLKNLICDRVFVNVSIINAFSFYHLFQSLPENLSRYPDILNRVCR